jgi:hypothetical protein
MLCAALAACSLAVPALARAQDTPEAVAQRFLETVRAQDWTANAALIYSPELDSLKAAFVEVSHVDTSSAGLRAIFQVSSVAELDRLSPAEVYKRFVTDRMAQSEERERAQVLSSTQFHMLGHIPEGDTAYVVYRVTATVPNRGPTSQVSMMVVRRERGVWKAPLSDELRSLIPQLHMAAERQRQMQRALANPPPPVNVTPPHP